MPDSIFKSGTLEIPSIPAPPSLPAQSWIDSDVNRILVVISVLLILSTMRSFLWVFPHVRQSLFRSRACLNLEHSVSLANSRDMCALVLVLPFCLIFDRYSVLSGLLPWNIPSWAGSAVVLAALVAYVLLRRVLCVCLKPVRMDYDYSNALYKTIYSFFILYSLLLIVSTAIFKLFEVPGGIASTVILCEAGVFYLLTLLRSAQFLSAFCSGLVTILYLCALEILPVATVVVPCVLLRL